MLLKKYLVFSITFVFLFVNSVYGSPKLKENFSIDKLIEYKAQMMINSQQDQKARNLTPKEKNDIKKQYETEILNWKATLETKLDWKDENYQQKLDFYIDKAFKDNPYLEDKFFLSSEDKEMILENAYSGVESNMQLNITKLGVEDSLNQTKVQLKGTQAKNEVQRLLETIKKQQDESYSKEKSDELKKYQVIEDFYKFPNTKSLICLPKAKSDDFLIFYYYVYNENEKVGYKFGVNTNRHRISSITKGWNKDLMKKIPFKIYFKDDPTKWQVFKHQDDSFLILQRKVFSKDNNADILFQTTLDKINLTTLGGGRVILPGMTTSNYPRETCKSIENKIIKDEKIYEQLETELDIREKNVAIRKPDGRKRFANNTQSSNIQFGKQEKLIFKNEKKEEEIKKIKESYKANANNGQSQNSKNQQQVINNTQITEKTNNVQITEKNSDLKKEDQKINDKQNENIVNKPAKVVNKLITDIISIPINLLGQDKLDTEELKLFITNNKITILENNSLKTYIFDKGFTFEVFEKNGKLIEKGKWRYIGLFTKNKILLEGKTKRYIQVFKDIKSILEKKDSSNPEEKGLVKKIHDFTPL